VHRGSQTGVDGREFAECGHVDGGVRGILARQHFSLSAVSLLCCGEALCVPPSLFRIVPLMAVLVLMRRAAMVQEAEVLKC
jgi:hypothetical protein